MDKIQGYMAISPSDPCGRGLLYATKEAAKNHQIHMNTVALEKWDDDKTWNKEYWGNEKPQPWEMYELILGNKLE